MKTIVAALLALPLIAHAELPQELVMPTDVGKVALTVKDCTVPNRHGFEYQAYATEFKDGAIITHKGCWMKQADIVYIWFYDEDPTFVASFKDYYFKPENKL